MGLCTGIGIQILPLWSLEDLVSLCVESLTVQCGYFCSSVLLSSYTLYHFGEERVILPHRFRGISITVEERVVFEVWA